MSPSRPPTVADLVEPQRLASIEDLDLVARWVVEGFVHGWHRSPYVGFSVDFASHRDYVEGDDLRHLNWKLYGRYDRLYVKQYEAETNVDLHLLLDVSASMTVGDDDLRKLRYGMMLCASLAHLASRQRDAVGLALLADRVVEHYPARAKSDHLMQLMAVLAQPRAHPPVAALRAWHEAAELIPRRGVVVLVSDLYYDLEELFAALDHLRHVGHDILVFQILAPLERRMPLDGPVRLVDAETGESLETLAHEIRESFCSTVEQWIQEIHHGCQMRDIDHVCLTTDQPLEVALRDYCVRRAHWF
jgi:uncharacterized protein (DUF58 family)